MIEITVVPVKEYVFYVFCSNKKANEQDVEYNDNEYYSSQIDILDRVGEGEELFELVYKLPV